VQRVKLADLSPGGVLAEPVYNQQGVLLLDAGCKLNAKHIRIFKSWGIESVCLKGHSAAAGDTSDKMPRSAGRQRLHAEMSRQFSQVLDDPLMVEIMECALRQRLNHAARQEALE
jgi:hypothetical protein